MSDLRKMTVESLRELARKLLGPGGARLRTRAALVKALRALGDGVRAAGKHPRATAQRAGKAVRKAGSRLRTGGAAPAASLGKPARKRSAEAANPTRRAGGAQPRRATRAREEPLEAVEGATDPAGFFVARVRGEDAVREAPHPMAEAGADTGVRVPEGVPLAPVQDERLGDLPWAYGDDTVVALARDPRSLFLCWDHAGPTLRHGFQDLDHPRAQLWVFARGGGGWDRVRVVDLALESRGHYLHDLDPGRTYRAELHAVDRGGRDRLLGPSSNEVALPPLGPSPVVDDRFIRLPWGQPLGGPLGAGHRGPDFPLEDREALARLSDWSRIGLSFGSSAGAGGPAAGGMGGRPSSPVSRGASSPSSPSGSGGGER